MNVFYVVVFVAEDCTNGTYAGTLALAGIVPDEYFLTIGLTCVELVRRGYEPTHLAYSSGIVIFCVMNEGADEEHRYGAGPLHHKSLVGGFQILLLTVLYPTRTGDIMRSCLIIKTRKIFTTISLTDRVDHPPNMAVGSLVLQRVQI